MYIAFRYHLLTMLNTRLRVFSLKSVQNKTNYKKQNLFYAEQLRCLNKPRTGIVGFSFNWP